MARLLDESELAQESVAMVRILGQFYNYCNQRIEEKETEKGVEGWSIVCNQTVWCDKTLFGVKVLQYWRLSCDLRRTDFIYGDDVDPTNYGGVYRGTMVIDVWHDLTQFDERFMNSVVSQSNVPICNYFNRKHDEYSPSNLTKQLMNTELEIHLDQRNMTSNGMTELFSLRDFTDRSAFSISHAVVTPHPHPWWNDNGYLDMTVPTERGPERIQSNFWYKDVFSGGLTYHNRYAQVVMDRFESFTDMTLSGPYNDYMKIVDDKITYGFVLLTDYQIFDDLRDGRGLFTVLGR